MNGNRIRLRRHGTGNRKSWTRRAAASWCSLTPYSPIGTRSSFLILTGARSRVGRKRRLRLWQDKPHCCERVYHTHDGGSFSPGSITSQGGNLAARARTPQHARLLAHGDVCADPSMFNTRQEQSQRPGHAAEVAKTFNELYMEAGVTNLCEYCGDRSDVSFAGRLHMHWANLEIEGEMPTVQIVCRYYSEQPVPGIHQWDCPNLVWELMNTRRVKLNAQQLLSRNISEAIVDKDNHARDAMKYFLMSYPEPTAKTLERRVNERVAELVKKDSTVAVAQYNKIVAEEAEEDESQYYGRNGRRRIQEAMRRRRRLGGR